MAYIRFDQVSKTYQNTVPLMAADGTLQHPGQYTSHPTFNGSYTKMAPIGNGLNTGNTAVGSSIPIFPPKIGQMQLPQVPTTFRAPARPGTQPVIPAQPAPKPKANPAHYLHIRGIRKLLHLLGTPDVSDGKRGGIAIWSGPTLKKRGYGYLRRVEIIDEKIRSDVPTHHYSNVYIWVHIKPDNEQLQKILSLTKDFYFDRKKELLIVRSKCLDTAIAQAAVAKLYVQGKYSFYNVVNQNLLGSYYKSVQNKKMRKAILKVLK